jgi:hypothetical protein
MPRLIVMTIGNDHTEGTQAGNPVADFVRRR